MKVTLNYFAQIRHQADVAAETVDVPDKATALEAIRAVEHGERFRRLLFDESGGLRQINLLIVNEVRVAADHVLCEGDEICILSPIAGG